MTDVQLKEVIRSSIKEVLREERLALYELLIPSVSKKELQEIETRYGSPKQYHENDFEDMTSWVRG